MFSSNESKNEEVEQEKWFALRSKVRNGELQKPETLNEVKASIDEMLSMINGRLKKKKWRRAVQSSPKPKPRKA